MLYLNLNFLPAEIQFSDVYTLELEPKNKNIISALPLVYNISSSLLRILMILNCGSPVEALIYNSNQFKKTFFGIGMIDGLSWTVWELSGSKKIMNLNRIMDEIYFHWQNIECSTEECYRVHSVQMNKLDPRIQTIKRALPVKRTE